MPSTRQDAWTQDEDLMLAEVVLRHIREGGTQLQAFEEVGRNLSRTAAACGFRWNSYVRKQYKSGIELAKKQRKDLKRLPEEKVINVDNMEHPVENEPVLSLEAVISFLQELKEHNEADKCLTLENEKTTLQNKIVNLEKENGNLKQELQQVKNDYRAFVEIMEKARKMVVLQEDGSNQKVNY